MVSNSNALTSPQWQDFVTPVDDVLPWLQMT
jgi:hypothetical protein